MSNEGSKGNGKLKLKKKVFFLRVHSCLLTYVTFKSY